MSELANPTINRNCRSVAVILRSQAGTQPWSERVWSLLAVLADDQGSPARLHQADGDGVEIHICKGLHIRLDPHSCGAYYSNLLAQAPRAFVAAHMDADGCLRPHAVSLDITEAEAWMERDDEVLSTPLMAELLDWLEAYVMRHYRPEAPHKRRRKQWFDRGDMHGRGR